MRRPTFFIIAILVLVADQLSKRWVIHSLSEYSDMPLMPPVLYFTQTTNTGAAFGMLQHATLLLGVTACLVIGGIVFFVVKSKWPVPVMIGTGLALPLGGALGNFLDRARLGHVIDFIEVRLGSYTWPIFNVADSAICVGVALLVIASVSTADGPQKSNPETHPIP
jgi:signal peptidase II